MPIGSSARKRRAVAPKLGRLWEEAKESSQEDIISSSSPGTGGSDDRGDTRRDCVGSLVGSYQPLCGAVHCRSVVVVDDHARGVRHAHEGERND